MSDSTEAQIRHIYEEWHAGTNSHDVPRVIALYAENATLESPAILAIYPHLNDGILRGRSEIEKFFTKVLGVLAKEFRELYAAACSFRPASCSPGNIHVRRQQGNRSTLLSRWT